MCYFQSTVSLIWASNDSTAGNDPWLQIHRCLRCHLLTNAQHRQRKHSTEARGFGRQGSLWRWERKRIWTCAAQLYWQQCSMGSQALFWSPAFWWSWHPSLVISSWAQWVMLWQLMALAQSPGCVLIPAGTLQQPRMKWGTARAGGDPA